MRIVGDIRNTDYSRQEIKENYAYKKVHLLRDWWCGRQHGSLKVQRSSFILVLFRAEPNEISGIWTVKA